MASAAISLWSAKIKPDILSPKQILRTQADALTDLTKGVLVGELSDNKSDDKAVILTLDMFAPTINYRHRVLAARHSPDLLYPVRLDADVFRSEAFARLKSTSGNWREMNPGCQADSDEELVKLVERVLNSPSVVSMAQSLIALSNEAKTPTNYIHYMKNLTEAEQKSAIEEKIAETYHEILDSEVFASTVAGTNATGWGVDEYEIKKFDIDGEECTVHLSYSASGDQMKDKGHDGDRVTGTAEAIIDSRGVVEYQEITAEVAHDYEEPDSEGASKQPE